MTGHFVRSFMPLMFTIFLNTIGQDWTLLTFVKEKNGGGGEKKATIKETVHNTEPLIRRGTKSNFVRFSETNSRKKTADFARIRGKIRVKFLRKTIVKKSQFR